MTNSLLSPSTLPFALPDYAGLSDADFREGIDVGMAEQLAELDAIATDSSPASVASVLEAWERSGATLTRAMHAFWVAKAADANDERNAILEEMAPRLAAHQDAILLDARLYERLRALEARVQAGEVALDEQEAHLLAERLRDYRRGGIDLGETEQQRLRELNSEIATLSTRFEQRLVAGRNAAGVHVTDESRLAGLSAEDLATARESATARGVDGWVLDIVNTTGQPVLASLQDRGLREEVFRASVSRGLAGEHDTREVLLALARLRDERAHLLGYPHHAAYVAEDGCAGTTAAVSDILGRLAPGAVANATREAEVLQERLHRIDPDATLEPWDWQYLAELVRAEQYSLDQAQLRPYLEFSTVLHEGVFAAATQLYGITFHERPDLVGYTPAAQVFEVREEDGQVLGAVVIDPYTRSTKQGGAWMTSIVDQSHLLGDAPVVTNTCNFPQPAPGSPSLLSWDNVITLFHEFGHDLHGLLSATRFPSRSGTSVPRDFVEYPSQVNEIWAWEPALLERYARHHETGEPMPREWIDTLRAARHFDEGYATVEILAAMLLDQAWHTTAAGDLPDVDGVEHFEQRALEDAGIAFALVPPRYRSAYFHHIFGGGYAAGYYSYLWSEVMDADTVAWFVENGGLTRANGDRFRERLLGRGGSIDVMDAYRDFRGADPDVRHLLERLGVA